MLRKQKILKYEYKRRFEHLIKAIEYKGGKCERCERKFAPEVYDFHHIAEKEYRVNSILRYSWKTLKKELDKCILLCSNCHQEIHDSMKINKAQTKMAVYMRQRREKTKKMSLEYLGKECMYCGDNNCTRALVFHHKSGDKEFRISTSNKSWNKIKKELDKCILVCGNCHRIIHSGSGPNGRAHNC